MLAARGGRSEKEKDRKDRNHYKSTGLCSQRRGWGWSGGGGPSREERGGGKWHEPRETRPRSGHPTRPNPTPTPPPNTRERHGPPPHSDNPRRHSLPSPWADIPALEPPWARRPSLPEKPHKEITPPRDFHMVNTSPPNTRDSPHPGKKWLQGVSLRREWYPRAPRRKDNSEMLSLPHSKCCRADTPIGEMGEGQRHLFRGASGIAFPWKESWPKTDLS